ncbi:hypothetical protein Pfo_030139 [Paulownia fortunei]|nr:hypothetical protein Pfo_030139 [Paulownia fortunei]
MGDFWSQLGPVIGTLMFICTFFEKYFPYHLWFHIETHMHKLVSLFSLYVQITFHEYPSDGFTRSKAYAAIGTYLGAKSCKQAERLRAEAVKGNRALAFSIDDFEEITDVFSGIKVTQTISFYPGEEERRYYQLTFRKKHRDFVLNSYLRYVMDEGRAIAKRNKQRRLYTNIPCGENWWSGGKTNRWSSVLFEHPASFDTLAMDPLKKQEIINDLLTFSMAKEYYAKIGKAWKRGYLLYGPPGTGKSTMIAAMANLLRYDVYDLELTAVKNNTELRKLLIETSKRSIIVIEDIDCSLNLASKRKKEMEKEEEKESKNSSVSEKIEDRMNDDKKSRVTLSGLLNFIDGLWSACGGERVIVFTTNHVEKLDPALIRRGRMDKHIEMSYCCFEGFKLLAKNYLGIESHHLFPEINSLLQEFEMTPADVAEFLMPKSAEEGSALTCLNT